MNKPFIPLIAGGLCVAVVLGAAAVARAAETLRPLGVARIDVTPTEPIRLTGYASRKTNSIGVEQKLWAKALAIGSDGDGPALLLTLDNCGIAEETYREVIARLARKGIKQDRVAIACSHTHSGPCTTLWAPNIFAQDIPAEHQAAIDRYTRELIDKLEQVALAALVDRRPAKLSWSQGSVGFAKNRRVVVGNTAQFGDNAAGPVDLALPVLLATDADNKVRAVVVNYACHCTTIGGEFNKLCGDWAGFAQEAIEREHPGAVALITIGCGADANPSPRGGADGGVALARQHGEELAVEVTRLLGQNSTPLSAKLTTKLKPVALPFGPQFTREQWEARAKESGINGYHAKKWLARIDRGEKLPDTLSYYVQTWNFGDDLALVFLSGEVVVDYALRLKKEFDATRLWVSSYANYVPCYIPSRRILAEGGYEAESSLWYYDRPTRLSTNAEDQIIKTVHELMPKSFRADPKKAEFPDPKTPRQALGTFRTHADLTVELVVSEPLIESPVAIDWGADGRLWVCEMYDYPTGLNPPADTGHKYGEPIKPPPGGFTPGGRIKVLTSSKHDGRYDRATLFLDKLSFPTGVMPWRKGALICAAPDILYAEDTDGDGRADVVRTNYTGFATHNFQARVNGFRWGLDGWLHGSSGLFGGKVKSLLTGKEVDLGGRDFRIQPDTGEIEPLAGISQYGRVRDDFDNWFGNDNSTLLWHYPLPDHYLRRNPYVAYPDPRVNVAANMSRSGSTRNSKPGTRNEAQGLLASVATDPNKVYPISRTLERFNNPESANRVTSACGIDIYRDVLLGANYYGNAFICEPVHNLVTRLVLEPDGVTFAGQRAADERHGEFLASSDNWFRPVQVRTGPDGALWVVDMYRFVIEHPRWIAPERLKELDVRAGADMGRIYRVYPKGAKLRPVTDLTNLSSIGDAMKTDLFRALDSPNGPARDLAQIELFVRHSGQNGKRLGSFASRLFQVLSRTFVDPAVCVQMLSNLKELGLTDFSAVLAGLTNANSEIRCAALRLSEAFPQDRSLDNVLDKLKDDPSPAVRLQLALTLGEWRDPRAATLLAHLASRNEPWIQAGVLSSASVSPAAIFKALMAASNNIDGKFASQWFATAAHSPDAREWQEMLSIITPDAGQPAQPWQWTALNGLLDALERNQVSLVSNSTAESRDATDRIRKSLAAARQLALEPQADEASREAGIRLLSHTDGERGGDLATLLHFLQPGAAARLQTAAIDSLRRQRGPYLAEALLKDWSRNSPSFRAVAMNLLLSRDEWAIALLEATERGSVAPAEIPLSNREQLVRHRNQAIRDLAGRLFTSGNSANRAELLGKYQHVFTLSGAPEHGAVSFERNCAQCHAYRGHGHAVGPNLAEFAGKSASDFVQAILDPNSAINPNFLAYNIDTKDGRSLSGLVRGETASSLTVLEAGGVQENILRNDLKEIRASAISLMPEGLEQALSPQDLADLIAWLKQGAPAPFGGASAEQAARARAEFLKGGVNGLAKVVACADQLPYPSWLGRLPMPHCRQDGGKLVWLTQPVALPRPLRAGEGRGEAATVVFRLPAAMGFISQPRGKFTLKLNGEPMFDFDVTLSDQTWQSADKRVRMIYTVLENNAEDSNGELVLEVDATMLKPGQPVEFEVNGSAANSQRWFGLYRLNP